VENSSGITKQGKSMIADCLADDPQAEANSYNAYVLNAVIGEQSFKVMLDYSHHHAKDS